MGTIRFQKIFLLHLGLVILTSTILPMATSSQIVSDSPSINPQTQFRDLLFDSVELFQPPEAELILELNLTHNWIYYFSLESYTPFTAEFSLDIFCASPTNKLYHFYDYIASLENNQSEIFFEYGAAENGTHTITFQVCPTENINLHVVVEEYMPLGEYYDRFTFVPIDEEILFFTDIHRYTSLLNTMSYTVPFQEDTAYWFNFFRVNPLSPTDKTAINYTNPIVEMTVTLDEVDFVYYPNIPTLDYALYNNLEMIFLNLYPEGRDFGNNSFNMVFGSHATDNATVSITLSQDFSFNLNFALVVFSTGIIGDGPDLIDDNATGDSIWIPDNNTSGSSKFNWDEWIFARYDGMRNFLNAQFPWVILILMVGIIGAGITATIKYKEKPQLLKNLAVRFQE
ncbi:MAG: hypothetical protein E4G98_02540 [Promethearchaeota archaeon]|nr:MAG: hypothetical protein E4G98_02540 [Candidatus Lokiarchaeota archaeon]